MNILNVFGFFFVALFLFVLFFRSGSRWKLSDTTASWTHSSGALAPSTMTQAPVQPTPIPLSGGKGLCVYRQFPLPCSLFQKLIFIFPEWALRMEQPSGGGRGLDFQLSALGFESVGSDNVHPEQTCTCFSTKPPADIKKRSKHWGRSSKQRLQKGLSSNSCSFMGSQTSFLWDLVSLTLNKQFFSNLDLNTQTLKKIRGGRYTVPIGVRGQSNYSGSPHNYSTLSGVCFHQRFFHSE